MTQESGECCCMAEFLPRAVRGGIGSILSKRIASAPNVACLRSYTPHAAPSPGMPHREGKKKPKKCASVSHNSAPGSQSKPQSSHLGAGEMSVTPQPGIKQIPAALGKTRKLWLPAETSSARLGQRGGGSAF